MLGIFLLGHCPVCAMDKKKEKPPMAPSKLKFSGLKRTKSFSHMNMNSSLRSCDLTIPNATQELEGENTTLLYEDEKGAFVYKGILLCGSKLQKMWLEDGSCILYDGYLISPQDDSEEASFEEKLKKYKDSLLDKGEKGEAE